MQKIRIDFDNPGLPQHISAVENDSQSRFFQATLYENGKAYTAPEGATYSIMYRGFGPQNQGWYDTINDGAGKRAACAVSGNVVTCEIARQALQVPGHVSIVLCVTTGKGYMLKSWPIECDCKNDRYDSTAEIQSFFYITQVSNADWTQAIQAWESLKDAIDPTLSVSGKAADAAKVGEAVGQVKEDLTEKTNQFFIDEFVAVSKSKNIFDRKSIVLDSELSSADGSVISNSAGYCVSDFISVGYNANVFFSHDDSQIYIMTQICLYTLSKKFIKKVKDSSELTTDDNSCFIRVCFKQNDSKVVQITLNQRYDYEEYQNVIVPVSKKTNKTWCAVGDSLTDPWFDVYASFVADKLGMILTNKGIGGTCVAQNDSATVVNSFVDRIPTYTGYYDLWSIYGGENDAACNTPIGDISSMDKTTFYGAYNNILADLLTRANRPTVVLIAPYQTKHNVKPYRDAVIEIGILYGLPVIDLYSNSGINVYTRPFYLRDDVHPNQNGVNKLRPYLLKKFSEICLPENTPKQPN